MIASVFEKILEDLVRSLPGAIGAVLVDWEGESVDGFSWTDNTNLRLTGAHWGISHHQLTILLRNHNLGTPHTITFRFEHQQVFIRAVSDGYLVMLATSSDVNLGQALFRIKDAEKRLRQEM